MRLHPIHGLAPILTDCIICGGDVGLMLLGENCNKICQEMLGQDYSGLSTQRLRDGVCTKCKERLKEGAVAFVCKSDTRSVMLSAEWADREGRSDLKGKIVLMSAEQISEMQKQIGLTQGTDNR